MSEVIRSLSGAVSDKYGRMEDLLRAIEDNEYRDQLLQEYGLSDL